MTNHVPEAESAPPDEEPSSAAETVPAEPAAAEPPEPVDPRRRKFVVVGAVLAALVALFGIIAWVDDATGPEAVVEEFFDAIVDKDVDRALSLVTREGYGVPYGEQATFMHPDAIADGWELLKAELDTPEGEYGAQRVDVTVGNDKKQAEGTIEVSESSDDWKLVDPFVTVAVPMNPLTYIQVNDRTVATDELFGYDAGGGFQFEYQLLPGLYTFFGDVKGTSTKPEPAELMLPSDYDYAGTTEVTPAALELTDTAQEDVQEGVNKLVDDCATFKVRQPAQCPFGIDSYFYTDDEHYSKIHDVTWKVKEYPRVRVTGAKSDNQVWPGLKVTVNDPGVIKLTAAAVDTDRDDAKLTAECEVSGELLRVLLGPDGEPQVNPQVFDTYYAAPHTGLGINTCGEEQE